MKKEINEKDELIKKSEISQKKGLIISYDEEELKMQFPNLTSEISQNVKQMSINGVSIKIDKGEKDLINDYEEDLRNPGVFDFIRRCNKLSDALNILDYLLKRKEISLDLYNVIKQNLSETDGLNKFLNKIGGYKEPGYYQKKYYKKYLIKNNLDNNDLD